MRVGKRLQDHVKAWCTVHKISLIALCVIGAVVVAGNGLYLFGWRDPNPTLQLSGLAVQATPRVLEGVDTIDPNNGFTTQALGYAAAKELLSGDMPFWNHYEGIGSPLAGEMQSAALSPFTLLLALPGGLLLMHIILEVIAGFFTYLFLKKLNFSDTVAVIGAAAFALNGTFAWLTNAVFNPIAFLPVLFYASECILSAVKKQERRGWVLFSLGLALSLYAGFPETAFINALLVGVWVISRIFAIEAKQRIACLRRFALATLVGIAVAAPILVAFLGYLPDANIGGHEGAFAHASLNRMSMPAQVMPYVYGTLSAQSSYDATGFLSSHWGSIGGYIPVVLFFLAVVGLFAPTPRIVRLVFGVWVFACLLKMFGFGPAEFIWNIVPTIKNAAFFRYATPSIYFAATVLGAFGLQALLDKKISRGRFALATLVTLGTLTVLTYIAHQEVWRVSSAPYYKHFAVASVVWAFGIVLSIVFTRIFIRKKYQIFFVTTIIAADLLLMFAIPHLSTPGVKISEAPVRFLQQNLGNSRFYTLGPIAPNYGSFYKIASINQNDLPVPMAWSNYLTKNLDSNTDPILFVGYFRANQNGPTAFDEFVRNQANFRYVGVKYLVTMHNQITVDQASQAGIQKVFESFGADIYEVSSPSAYFSTTAQCSVVEAISRDEVMVRCASRGSLTRKELNLPGWKVSVNGSTVAAQTEQGIFQKVNLLSGESRIKYSYLPPYMGLAFFAFFLGLAVIGVEYFIPERYRRRLQVIAAQRLPFTSNHSNMKQKSKGKK